MEFPNLLDRFLRYVKIDTQSKEDSKSFPSTEKQFNLANLLKDELKFMKLENVQVNKWGYVSASLRTNQKKEVPTIALISHLDTSPDVSGENVNPRIHKNYDGKDIILSKEQGIVLKVKENPHLQEKRGKTLITTDGKTLLGADDKAGIAEIMSALNYLTKNQNFPRPNIRIIFTPDEEVGRGTEHITKEDISADYGYTIDGEKVGEIENETFCADSVDVIIGGVNVHPGHAKDKLVNSIKIAAEIIGKFPKESMSPETTEKREGYIHPHHITGNVEQTTIKILVRDFEEKGLKQKETFIQKITESISEKYPEATIDFKVNESYRNMKIILNRHPEALKKAEKAVEMSGLKPVKSIIRGGTDGAKLSFMGLPCPNLFTGGTNFHSRYEWITLEDIAKSN